MKTFRFGELSMNAELSLLDASIDRLGPGDSQVLDILGSLQVVAGVTQRIGRYWRRSDLEAPPPLFQLFLAILVGNHCLALSGQGAVYSMDVEHADMRDKTRQLLLSHTNCALTHSLVEAPALDHLHPNTVELIQDVHGRVNGST